MNTGSTKSTVLVHKKVKSSNTRMDCLRSVLDGVKRCMNATIDEEEVAAFKAELDSALKQLEEERLFVEDILEEKKSDEKKHFKRIGKLVDEKMRAVFENTILKEHIETSREYYKEGAKELNSVIDKLRRAHNDLIGDHRLLQRKYAAAAFERRSWQAQVEQSFIALQNASTAKKVAEDELALQQAQTEQYRLHATILAQEAEDQKRSAEELSIALEEAVAAKQVVEEELALQSDRYRSNGHIFAREVEVREKVAEELRTKIQEMASEIIRIKSHLAESERSKQRLVDDATAQGFLLDSLWARVYDPTRRSLPIEEIEALRDERESLIAAVEAKGSIIDQLTFRLAVTTPLPPDGCSPTELLIVELSSRVEELTNQRSTSEETVSKLNVEVTSLMEEKEVLFEELSSEREKVHQIQVVEEMMKSKVEELSASGDNLRIEHEQLRAGFVTTIQEKQELGKDLLLAQEEIAFLGDECKVASELLLLYEEHDAVLVEELEKAKSDLVGHIQDSKLTEHRLKEDNVSKSVEISLLQQQLSHIQVAKDQEMKGLEVKLSKLEFNSDILRHTASELRSALDERDQKLVKADFVIIELKTEIETLRDDQDRKEAQIAALESRSPDADSAGNQGQPPAVPILHPHASTSSSPGVPPSSTPHDVPTSRQETFSIPTFVSDRSYSNRSYSSTTSRRVASHGENGVLLGAGSPQYISTSYPASYENGRRRGTPQGRPWKGGGPSGNPSYGY